MTMNVDDAMSAKTSLEAMMPYRILLQSALDLSGGTHTFEDVVEAVDEGLMQFWPASESCLVTQLIVYPQVKAIHIFLAAGNLEQIKDFDESLDDFARQLDAEFITLSGRKGWQRTLKDIGYQTSHVTMYKEVSNVDG